MVVCFICMDHDIWTLKEAQRPRDTGVDIKAKHTRTIGKKG